MFNANIKLRLRLRNLHFTWITYSITTFFVCCKSRLFTINIFQYATYIRMVVAFYTLINILKLFIQKQKFFKLSYRVGCTNIIFYFELVF